jgi:3-isopropylmalate dehydrogenase
MSFSPLKAEILKDTSFIIVRELTGDLYFGEPRGTADGKAWNTMIYSQEEIRRIAHTAFQLSRKRQRKVCSVDKANVLETMVLWRKTVEEVHALYPDVALNHMYVDNAAMQIIRHPSEFDVMLTPNMFGDILSDEASVLAGSLGLLPSASLGEKHGLYEPIHGSAPDIAGSGIANPIGLILSIAMMFELSLNRQDLSNKLKQAVGKVLEDGYRTKDIHSNDTLLLSTDSMGDEIVKNLIGAAY